MGEQDVADQRGAFACREGPAAHVVAGPSSVSGPRAPSDPSSAGAAPSHDQVAPPSDPVTGAFCLAPLDIPCRWTVPIRVDASASVLSKDTVHRSPV